MREEKKQANQFSQTVKIAGAVLTAVVVTWLGYAALQESQPEKDPVEVERGVLLLPAEGKLIPGSTLRVKFESVVVDADQVGKDGALNPLKFSPPLKGKFVWDSTRSGSFTPAEAFPLAARYTITLQPVAAKAGVELRRMVSTPDMAFTVRPGSEVLPDNRRAELRLSFNVQVKAAEASEYVVFEAEDGGQIEAEVKLLAKASTLPARVDPATGLPAMPLPPQLDKQVSGDAIFPTKTTLLIRPKTILETGKKWSLVIKDGLPSADGRHELPKAGKVAMGSRKPFLVTEVYASNQLNVGRAIHVNLNRRLRKSISAAEMADCVQVWMKDDRGKMAQSKAGFLVTSYGTSLRVNGPFMLGRDYQVRVTKDLPSELGLMLHEATAKTVQFRPIPSRIYLPAETAAQAADGARRFGFVSVNNRAVRLRVKRLEPGQLLPVLRAYHKQYQGADELKWSGTWKYRDAQPLNFELIPGQPLLEKVFHPEAPTDTAAKEEFSWDDLLGPTDSSALFVSLESVGRDSVAACAQAVVQLTDIGLVWKEASSQLTAQVFSLRTAKPLAGAELELMDDSGPLGTNVQTTADGTGTMVVQRKPKGQRWVRVKFGEDQLAFNASASLWRARLPMWRFNVRRSWGNEQALKVHLLTDRLVYQPGDTVHLKGHVREWADGRLRVPAARSLTVKAVDSRGQTYHRAEVAVSSRGAFDANIRLAPNAMGGHRIVVGSQWHFFDVYEYEPATYKLRFPGKSEFAAAETVEVAMGARFYFGKPLSGAKVKWSFDGYQHGFSPAGWDGFQFGGKSFDSIELEGEAKLGPDGTLKILPAIKDDNLPGALRGSLHVAVTDANQQTISGSKSIVRHGSAFYLGVKELPDVLWAQKALSLNMVAVKPDGSESPKVPVKVTLKRVHWRSVKVQGAGGAVRYQNKRELKTVASTRLWTGTREDEPREVGLMPRAAGQYELHLESADAAGRPVFTATQFHVSGPEPLAWDYSTEFQMELVADRKRYTTGDTARILLKAPFSGEAWVTVEREKILRSFRATVEGNAPVIEVPLDDVDAPNVFVSVMLMRGSASSVRQIPTAEYRMGYVELNVEQPGSRLVVIATLPKTEVQPGGTVETTVQVLDADGQAAAGAEVTIYAVDEGILDLTGYQAPDLHEFFFEARGLEVLTSSTLPLMHTEDPAQVHYGNKGITIGGGGGGTLRKKFLAVAFWNASLITNTDGKVTARFVAPDSLTRYRLIAVAHAGTQFGAVESGFRVHLPLMVEAALPRFARKGDRLVAKALVYNQTPKPMRAVVQLELDDRVKTTAQTRRIIQLPANGSLAVDIPLEFASVGRARTVWRVNAEGQPNLRDARESFVDVRHVATERRQVEFIRTRARSQDLLEQIDPALRQADGTYLVGISNSPMAELNEAIDYLLLYPHGCVEQTSSRLIPWLLLEEYDGVFLQLDSESQEARKAVQGGINRLLSMQDYAGGLAYWPGGTAEGWASAYGGMVLAIAKERGHAVAPASFNRLRNYLVKLVRNKQTKPDARALALYTLTVMGTPQPSVHEAMFVDHKELSNGTRALLAMAVARSGGSAKMIEDLLRPQHNDRKAFGFISHADTATAMRLLARTTRHASHPEATKLVGIITQSARSGHWGNTFGNAWVIYAMAEYSRNISRGDSVQGALVWRGKEHPFALNSKQRAVTLTFNNQAGPDEPPMLLRNPGVGQLFVNVRATMRPAVDRSPAIAQGLKVQRKFARLADNGEPVPEADWRVGDLVRVTLQLDAAQRTRYVALEDGLAACLEPLNLKLRTQSGRLREGATTYVSHRVLRKDRAVFYLNDLPRGTHHFTYLARVRAAGTAVAPSAKAEAMYEPDIVGVSASEKLKTLPIK